MLTLHTMEQYTTVTRRINEITGNNKLIDTVVYTYIKSRVNYKTNIADNVTEQEMSFHLGLSIDTIENVVPRVSKHTFLFDKVEQDEEKKIGSYKTYNRYYLIKDNENFFFVYNSFFNDDINITNSVDRCKVKGLLLLIKSVCIKETNKYVSGKPRKNGLNKSELARKLGIDTDTLTKYLQLAIRAG